MVAYKGEIQDTVFDWELSQKGFSKDARTVSFTNAIILANWDTKIQDIFRILLSGFKFPASLPGRVKFHWQEKRWLGAWWEVKETKNTPITPRATPSTNERSLETRQRILLRRNHHLLAILIKAFINFILLTRFDSLHISVTTQNISLFTICNRNEIGDLRLELSNSPRSFPQAAVTLGWFTVLLFYRSMWNHGHNLLISGDEVANYLITSCLWSHFSLM